LGDLGADGRIILYNVTGYLTASDHQLYRVTSLKAPFGLLIPLLQSSITYSTLTRSSLQSLTIIYYAVSHLHSLQSYTFVTTITYYTLTLADFSAINYCLKLSQTLHLHASKLSPRTYSANSFRKTAT
jgi:hypothetical protein